ncbi:MAG: sigma-70 family RNA polymerase sigma factor [Clostridia bacterium]|nr:sigma-70 family RNA polymerase sigma factor [Clostridia bacterium]
MPDYRNDNEAVAAAVAGDEKAMSFLIASVMPGVEVTATLNAGDGTITRSDLIQEGLIGAINAIFSFDASKGIKFSTYAQKCISNRILSVVRDNGREKRQSNNAYVPLEEIQYSVSGNSGNPESVVSMEESVENIKKCIDTKLTDLERDVLLLHIADNSYEQISQKLAINTRAVGNALSRARQKIKAEIGS